MTERAAKAKQFAEVLKPLYATFTEDQKAVAGKVLNHFGQDGRGQHGPALGDERDFRPRQGPPTVRAHD